MAQTALVGVPVRGLTLAHTRYSGTPPSRLKLHSILTAGWRGACQSLNQAHGYMP